MHCIAQKKLYICRRKTNDMKETISKAELKARIEEEAKDMKSQGTPLTLSECKKEARKVFMEEFIIKN